MQKSVYFFALVFLLLQNACGPSQAIESEKSSTSDSIVNIESKDSDSTNVIQHGVMGIFDVPEMLALVILDSAKMQAVNATRAKNFEAIEREMQEVGAQMDGSPGSIYYSNNPDNFKFESLILIKELPKTAPKKSKVVVLEANKMLVYNHIGSYQNLYKSYNDIRNFLAEKKLEMAGPMREFYVTTPLQSSDSTAWLTRIMVPINPN